MLLTFAPDGGEFRVNTFTPNNQLNASVAADADGDFLVAWESAVQDGSGFGIYAQRYRADGSPAGTEFRVNTTTFRFQVGPAVAMDADGDFVVVWMNHENDFERDVYARRYNATGLPLGGEIVVNTVRAGDQGDPAVAMSADGGFVVAWDSFGQDGDGRGIIARRYSAAGDPVGGELFVNTTTAGNQTVPAVAVDAAGGFAVAWKSDTTTYARRFDSSGAPAGDDFVVDRSPLATTEPPAVVAYPDGRFLVAWDTYSTAGGVFTGDVSARRYRADGAPAGDAFVVNETMPGAQTQPAAAGDANGNMVLTWTSYAADGGPPDVYARRFAPDGSPLGGDFLVNTATAGVQSTPAVAVDADGDCVIAWHSNAPARSEFDVYAQRYRNARPPAVTGVFIGSSHWSAAFQSQLQSAGLGSAPFGYAVDAARQLATLAWADLDQVSIRFNENVAVAPNHLAVRGTSVASYPTRDFRYDPFTRTATWTLDRPVRADKILLDLDGAAGGVAAGGLPLDGEWTGNGGVADTFPSGDGTAGGDFRFRINVLPGDVNGDRVVDARDVLDVRRDSRRAGSQSPRDDINGDGTINSVDQATLRRVLGTRLPAGEPATSAPGATQVRLGTALPPPPGGGVRSLTRPVTAVGILRNSLPLDCRCL